jgi:AAA15 family ATPase/GTPase
MRLVSFSVENYRSITRARKIGLDSNTVLIGPNNEGKSNILRALTVAMEFLTSYREDRNTGIRLRSRYMDASAYDWKRDSPIGMGKKVKPTEITLEFQLDADEVLEFKSEIKSNINGTLFVCISFEKNKGDVNIKKPGRGSITLNLKKERIAQFLARRIQFHYIPAVRTADSALAVVQNIVASELKELETDDVFQKALQEIRDLQKPILDSLSSRVSKTLKQFVPSINSIS